MRNILFGLAIALACATSSATAAIANQLAYSGDGYVAGGKTDTVSSLDGFDFTVSQSDRHSLSFYINDFASNPDFQDTQFFMLMLAAPSNTELQAGLYQGASRAPFQGAQEPGLWFAGNGRGSNQITGEFRILEITFDGDRLASLAVDFVQNEENGYLGQTVGSLRYQSMMPLSPVPEASAFTMALIALGGVVTVCRRREKRQPIGA